MSTLSHEYDDIIDLSHPVSTRHKPMPPDKRAAQFAPFAALTGYEDIVRETARLTDEAPQLGEDEKNRIDSALAFLAALTEAGERPEVELIFFKRDGKKSGGKYISVRGKALRVDADGRRVALEGGASVPIDDVTDIKGGFLSLIDPLGEM